MAASAAIDAAIPALLKPLLDKGFGAQCKRLTRNGSCRVAADRPRARFEACRNMRPVICSRTSSNKILLELRARACSTA